MNSIFNSFYIQTNYLRANILPLTSRQKKILLIASLAFGLLATAGYIFYCWFKAKSLNHENDKQKGNTSPPLYFPKELHQDIPLSKNQKSHPVPLISLNSVKSNKEAPLYLVDILPLGSSLPPTKFLHILNYNVEQGIVEFLIECQTSGDPEVQAFWDEENNRLYVVGGKNEEGTQTGPYSYTLAPHHSFWIRLDLTTIEKKGIIDLYAKLPETEVRAGPHHKLCDVIMEEHLHLLSVSNEMNPNSKE